MAKIKPMKLKKWARYVDGITEIRIWEDVNIKTGLDEEASFKGCVMDIPARLANQYMMYSDDGWCYVDFRDVVNEYGVHIPTAFVTVTKDKELAEGREVM